MSAEKAFAALLAPYRDAARERVDNGTARSPSDWSMRPVTEGSFTYGEVVEDVDGIPTGIEQNTESLGFTDSTENC